MLVDVLSHSGRAKLCFKMLAPIVAEDGEIQKQHENRLQSGGSQECHRICCVNAIRKDRRRTEFRRSPESSSMFSAGFVL